MLLPSCIPIVPAAAIPIYSSIGFQDVLWYYGFDKVGVHPELLVRIGDIVGKERLQRRYGIVEPLDLLAFLVRKVDSVKLEFSLEQETKPAFFFRKVEVITIFYQCQCVVQSLIGVECGDVILEFEKGTVGSFSDSENRTRREYIQVVS